MEGYLLNTTTGALTAIWSAWFAFQRRNFLRCLVNSTRAATIYSSTGSTTPQLAVMDVTAGTGALTEPLTPTPLVTTGYWAVTDPQ